MATTLHPSPVLLTGEAPARAATVRAARERLDRRATTLWISAASLVGASAAGIIAWAVANTVVLPIHI